MIEPFSQSYGDNCRILFGVGWIDLFAAVDGVAVALKGRNRIQPRKRSIKMLSVSA